MCLSINSIISNGITGLRETIIRTITFETAKATKWSLCSQTIAELKFRFRRPFRTKQEADNNDHQQHNKTRSKISPVRLYPKSLIICREAEDFSKLN